MDITHDNVCSSMLSCFYSHLLSTGRPISSYILFCLELVRSIVYLHVLLMDSLGFFKVFFFRMFMFVYASPYTI